jgi:hypothetical protein
VAGFGRQLMIAVVNFWPLPAEQFRSLSLKQINESKMLSLKPINESKMLSLKPINESKRLDGG